MRIVASGLVYWVACVGCDDGSHGAESAAQGDDSTDPSSAARLPGSVESQPSEPARGCPAQELESQLERSGTVHQRSVRGRETWSVAASPHRFPKGIHVHRNGRVTIAPCALLVVGDGYDVYIDNGGTLVAKGAAGKPVRFDSASPKPSPGAWKGIAFHENARSQSRLVHTIVEDAGGGERGGAIHAEGSFALDLRHVTIRHAERHGVVLADEARFADEARSLTVADSGRKDPYSVPVRFGSASQVRTLPTGDYTGNASDEIFVDRARVRTTSTWRDPGVAYRLSTGLDVGSSNGVVLTVRPGVELLFNEGTVLAVGEGKDGSVVLDGSHDGERVVLESGRPEPAAGDWQGIRIGAERADSAMKIDFVSIRHAGAEPQKELRFERETSCRPNSKAAIAIAGRDLGERVTNTEFIGLPSDATAILVGFRSDETTDYTMERHGNDFGEAGTDCRQNRPPAEGECPKSACR